MFVRDKFQVMYEADGGNAGAGEGATQTTNTGDGATDNAATKKQEEPMIPKNRFDEINNKYKEMLEKVQTFEQAELDRQKQAEAEAKKQAEEQGEFEKLYKESQNELENFKKFQERSTELEGLINNMVKNKLESIDEQFHDIIPTNLTPEATLDWLNKAEAKGLFGTNTVKEIGNSKNNQQSTDPKVKTEGMSPLEKILNGLGR